MNIGLLITNRSDYMWGNEYIYIYVCERDCKLMIILQKKSYSNETQEM